MLFFAFLVSQAIKRETSPGTTGITSEDESEVKENEKEDLMAQGLTEEQAQAVMDAWNETMKSFVPKERFDEVMGN